MNPSAFRSVLSSFLFLSLSFSLSPSPVPALEDQNANLSLCPYDDIEQARKKHDREHEKISHTGGRVFRNGWRLALQSRDRLVVLEDDCSVSESAIRYLFESHLAGPGYFQVGVSLYEGRGTLLVNDRTGGKTWLKAPPLISPDNKRFVTMSMDLEASYNPNEIQIWRLEPAGPVLEYSANFGEQWGPSDPVWKDMDTIEFTKNMLNPLVPNKLISNSMLLLRKGKTWEMREDRAERTKP
jgi:hypothetical protein